VELSGRIQVNGEGQQGAGHAHSEQDDSEFDPAFALHSFAPLETLFLIHNLIPR
jgi:hypothetical protein